MKLTIKQITTIVLLLTSTVVNAQKIIPLKIGDIVPDMFLKQMLNHKSDNSRLSDFKGKALIIDQWFIGCVPCVTAFAHLDSIQKEFADDLQILPVTFEKKNNVEEFWKYNILVKGIKFPQVVEDTLVRSYFPVSSFPQQIWIDKTGKVIGITDGRSATRENINKLIKGEALNLRAKKDELDPKVKAAVLPNIMSRFEENKKNLLYYSYFSGYRPELSGMSSSKLDTVNSLVRVVANNSTLFNLYDMAYADGSWKMRHLPTRFVRKDTNPLKGRAVRTPAGYDFTQYICYELMYQGTTTKGYGKRMIADLDKFFNLKSHEEMMDIDCYVISPNGNGNRYRDIYQPERKSYHTVSLTKAKRVLVNDISLFFIELTINAYSNQLILFEIEGKGNVSFDVSWNLDNLELMNADLSKFDLKIEKAVRKRAVIVLQDL